MSLVDRFLEYEAAWEQAYATDGWSRIAPFFTEDAVYETIAEPPFGSRIEGRAAIMDSFKQICDRFDRRFQSRDAKILEGPFERDGEVWCRWRMTYAQADAPDFVMDGEETASFRGDRIALLVDRIVKVG